ncbi:hypothetical protein SADUNF_Sadunf01G0058500 [Salix dunnii]|uniref:Caleosin n=1 Tax=Salix dunnii TaxID=1413687 RepID=A0A835NAP7_9ROSI|nr:hypothetical protein SADUNF_Sadunf01G0058500 [Salix dunnii]
MKLMPTEIKKDSLAGEAPNAPVTYERSVRDDLDDKIPKPYMARGLQAPDIEYPHGTPGHKHHGWSVLQQHVAFFDQDDNGIVYPWETYIGKKQMIFFIIPDHIFTLHLLFPKRMKERK